MIPDHLQQNPLTAQRLEKLQTWQAAGLDPYPNRFDRSHLAQELHDRYQGLEAGTYTDDMVLVAGRIMLLRSFGKLIFATVADQSGRIQLYADASRLDPESFDLLDLLDVGDWVGAEGVVMTTRRGELSVAIDRFQLLAKGLQPLPEKWAGLVDVEVRSRRRYLDLIMNPEARQIARTRVAVVSALRRQFEQRGFLEVETPILQTIAGGALARPFVTHHNALDIPLYLRIATELHLKRLIVGGLERVFEIGRIFRNEGIDSTHNPEFTMLESYQALADYREVAAMTEEILRAVAEETMGTTEAQFRGHTIDLGSPFRTVTHLELASEVLEFEAGFGVEVDELQKRAVAAGVKVEAGWGLGKLYEEAVDQLAVPKLIQPTFVFDYPREISPLAKPHAENPELVERFELFIGGIEFANAFSELNDPIDQRARFIEQAAAKQQGDQEAHPIDEDYLLALEFGMPPTGGLGIGVDRLVMLMTGADHQREVYLFPTMRPEAVEIKAEITNSQENPETTAEEH